MIYYFTELNKDEVNKELKNYNKTNIIYYYSNYCSYCNELKPLWKKIERKYKKNTKVNIINVENEDIKDLNVRYKRNITGLPTIVRYINNRKKEYKGDREYVDITKFIENNLRIN